MAPQKTNHVRNVNPPTLPLEVLNLKWPPLAFSSIYTCVQKIQQMFTENNKLKQLKKPSWGKQFTEELQT